MRDKWRERVGGNDATCGGELRAEKCCGRGLRVSWLVCGNGRKGREVAEGMVLEWGGGRLF